MKIRILLKSVSVVTFFIGLVLLVARVYVFYYNYPQLITGVVPVDFRNENVRVFYVSCIPFVILMFSSLYVFKQKPIGWVLLNFFFLFYLIGPILFFVNDRAGFQVDLLGNLFQIMLMVVFLLLLQIKDVKDYYVISKGKKIIASLTVMILAIYFIL